MADTSTSVIDLEARIRELERIVYDQELSTRDVLHADDGNAAWLLFGVVLVFLLQAGFALLEVGSVQLKNTGKILMKNIFDASVAGLFWWATGYGLAFGTDAFSSTGKNGFIGGSGFFYQGIGSGDEASPLTTTPFAKTYGKATWLFQWAFAGTAATIVSGAVAERCSMLSYFIYSCCITGFIYPVIVHMAWSLDGRFSPKRTARLFGGCGMIDWAGSGVVHLTGGTAALIACVFVGPRTYRFGRHARHLQQQSQVFQTLGVLLLWVGWYGFNGVSTLVIDDYGGVAAHAMMTTTISAATGCLTTTAMAIIIDGDLDVSYSNNGILAGLVAITAGCATVNLFGAFFTGFLAAPVYVASSRLLELLRIDDVVDAFPVHGCCGLWGIIAAACFSTKFYYSQAYNEVVSLEGRSRANECAGIFYGGNGGSFSSALVFALVNIAWTGSIMTILLTILKVSIGVRANEELSDFDMEDSKHGGQVQVLSGQVNIFEGSVHSGGTIALSQHQAQEHVSSPALSRHPAQPSDIELSRHDDSTADDDSKIASS